MKKATVEYLAHIEYARAVRSRAELKVMEQNFRTDKDIAPNFIELKGRKFFFRFNTRNARLVFLKNMEKVFKHHKEATQRDGW